MNRRVWRRTAGALLVLYGVVGFGLVVGGAVLVASSAARLDGLAATLDTQRQVLVRSLDATATFLRDARTGTGNVQTSLTSTVDSARQAGTLAQNLGTAMDALASASSISIFGSQPLASLGGTFSDVARQSAAMGASLTKTADALETNGADLQAVREDLSTIGAELDALRSQVSGSFFSAADIDGVTRAIETSRLVLLGLLVWLGVQALIAVIAGIVVLRWPPPPVVEPVLVDRAGLPFDDAS